MMGSFYPFIKACSGSDQVQVAVEGRTRPAHNKAKDGGSQTVIFNQTCLNTGLSKGAFKSRQSISRAWPPPPASSYPCCPYPLLPYPYCFSLCQCSDLTDCVTKRHHFCATYPAQHLLHVMAEWDLADSDYLATTSGRFGYGGVTGHCLYKRSTVTQCVARTTLTEHLPPPD